MENINLEPRSIIHSVLTKHFVKENVVHELRVRKAVEQVSQCAAVGRVCFGTPSYSFWKRRGVRNLYSLIGLCVIFLFGLSPSYKVNVIYRAECRDLVKAD